MFVGLSHLYGVQFSYLLFIIYLYLFVCIYLSIIYLSIFVFVFLYIYLSTYFSIYLFTYLSCLLVHLFICLFIHTLVMVYQIFYFIFFIFLWSTRVFPFAPTYSSIVMRKSDLRSSFGTKCLVKLFLSFLFQGFCFMYGLVCFLLISVGQVSSGVCGLCNKCVVLPNQYYVLMMQVIVV